MPKHRSFIGKNAVTYQVVNCESEQYDEAAPKTVWIPKSANAPPVKGFPAPSSRKKETVPKPERTFPTTGPRPDWDPDVVAGLDEDFDYSDPENILEDDFISKAGAIHLADIVESCKEDGSGTEDGQFSDAESFNFSDCDSFDSQDSQSKKRKFKKSSLSQYSMTSAVTNCTESVKTFNEHFEKILEGYDDEEIGALDCENIEGHVTDENHILEILCSEKKIETLNFGNYEERLRRIILDYAENEPKEKYVDIVVTAGKVEFDCESILSTNSNIYNHPSIIKANYKKKSLEPSMKSVSNGSNIDLEEESSEEDSDDELPERLSALPSIRPKNETPEERKERKKVLKAAKREQRILKKGNKIAFKNEKKKLTKQEVNLKCNAGLTLL